MTGPETFADREYAEPWWLSPIIVLVVPSLVVLAYRGMGL